MRTILFLIVTALLLVTVPVPVDVDPDSLGVQSTFAHDEKVGT